MKIDTSPDMQATPATGQGSTLHLRILATSDVHANLMPYDYFLDRDERPFGLARLATLIRAARNEAPNCLLLDNGDMLQGTPISDMLEDADDAIHPVISAMNHLQYDAAGLGNHEFNFGLDWLRRKVRDARFPYVCANLSPREGAPASAAAFWSPSHLLDRTFTAIDGGRHALRIGIVSVMPPQVTTWDRTHLEGRIESADMVEATRREAAKLRAGGADLVILLAHTGIEEGAPHPGMENAAIPLARLGDIDAMVMGHVHSVFPSSDFAGLHEVDLERGTIAGTPAVMPGYRGSHLGLLDLDLVLRGERWEVLAGRGSAWPVAAGNRATVESDSALRKHLAPAHNATLRRTRASLGEADGPLHTYLSLIGYNPAERLIARVQRAALSRELAGGPFDGVPILSSVAPFRAGGRSGPGAFTDVPAGPLALRHAADLYAFPNTLVGLAISGADLREWLESAAILFNTVQPGAQDAPLRAPDIPPHVFEIVDGVTYEIDLSQPPRRSLSGQLVDARAHRIANLRHEGRPVRDADRFILATNNYRAAGSGPFAAAHPAEVVHEGQTWIRDLLAQHLSAHRPVTPDTSRIWRFLPMPGTTAILSTGPGFAQVCPRPDTPPIEPLGIDQDGFLRLRLAL
ncbi:bifunctional 2',3'-cyclic-nucleotide 2'-phosphodiesterase/3'-nucleotidase [Roseovarius sp. SCSIO 43702]|uniref:bifunctional 2',3'-cyclic-nucleotide 2'-phosphodiesterase/3'-nucleotidase n=1 Tax=Roseovarius sp. SCSIO 43702 TaxID=2823043 RepID=UPI001C730215|nr:bifunctional 2',3'-cyclic-nucleotide 2'-phosphodiesterase/3'-nucleotidase [Roseovarius sp. SCSIO 43702]QYX56404.1 bifunctional 2',3'-cyclic-nucleotide 2'-phosphodiesterase/3'-nucleotidase [Roseovarius sp. SCSIO 43702]